ncbi:hypothetical protein [Nonomuraea sp. LPB2021202275-12-8]|uniref:hypothetical protein n=1 Tax=Nonomuraea sp. LPB2021202275-12-8 TaxID=3120159 RepID=UPI00300C419F
MKRMLTIAGILIAAAGVPQATATASVQAQPMAAAVDLPVHRGKFWFHSDCVTAGQEGVDRGHWSHYKCAEGWLWNLWTDR